MFSMPDMAVVLVIVLIVFGPGKLPDIGSALGKGLKSLRKATEEEEHASTLHELAAEFNVSAERIRQIEQKALSKMQAHLALPAPV